MVDEASEHCVRADLTVDVSIVVIVNAIAGNLSLIYPHVFHEVRVSVVNSAHGGKRGENLVNLCGVVRW